MRVVCGIDVYKDSVFVCILNDKGEKIEAKYGVFTPELEELHQLHLTHDVKEMTLVAIKIGVVLTNMSFFRGKIAKIFYTEFLINENSVVISCLRDANM